MKPYAYACPAKCGCIWRDNGDTPPVGQTMSLFGPNSKSCAVCEPLPLDKLVPLYDTAAEKDGRDGELLRIRDLLCAASQVTNDPPSFICPEAFKVPVRMAMLHRLRDAAISAASTEKEMK